MPKDSYLPFGHDTVKLRAVFIPDRAEVSMAEITQEVGPNPVIIRAVWVPDGGALPGYPYEHIGQAVFIPDSDDRERSSRTGSQRPWRTQRRHEGRITARLVAGRQDDLAVPDNQMPQGPRELGSSLGSAAGPWAPDSGPAAGDRPSGVSAPRRSVRSTQSNFGAAVPTPYIDASRDAIDAAVRAISLIPADWDASQYARWGNVGYPIRIAAATPATRR